MIDQILPKFSNLYIWTCEIHYIFVFRILWLQLRERLGRRRLQRECGRLQFGGLLPQRDMYRQSGNLPVHLLGRQNRSVLFILHFEHFCAWKNIGNEIETLMPKCLHGKHFGSLFLEHGLILVTGNLFQEGNCGLTFPAVITGTNGTRFFVWAVYKNRITPMYSHSTSKPVQLIKWIYSTYYW